MLAGGLLLLWVCWRMFRELRRHRHGAVEESQSPKTLRQAMMQIVLADVSMSLDNVLAVAGAANGSTWILSVGLALSVVLMGVAASLIAGLLERFRWIAWVGLLIVLYVALRDDLGGVERRGGPHHPGRARGRGNGPRLAASAGPVIGKQ